MEGDDIYVYEVIPCRIVENNKESEEQLYSSYLYAIKMISFDYQVIVSTERIEFKDIKNQLDNNIYSSNNYAQKLLIQHYKEYLLNFSNEIKIYQRKMYIVIRNMHNSKQLEIKEMINALKNIGVRVRYIDNEEEIFRLLYETINDVNGEIKNDNRKHISKLYSN